MMVGMNEINALNFKNDEGNIVELLASECNLIWVFQGYYQQSISRDQSLNQWKIINN